MAVAAMHSRVDIKIAVASTVFGYRSAFAATPRTRATCGCHYVAAIGQDASSSPRPTPKMSPFHMLAIDDFVNVVLVRPRPLHHAAQRDFQVVLSPPASAPYLSEKERLHGRKRLKGLITPFSKILLATRPELATAREYPSSLLCASHPPCLSVWTFSQ